MRPSDNVKQINDRLGHKTGDAVPRHFALRLANGFRATDQEFLWR